MKKYKELTEREKSFVGIGALALHGALFFFTDRVQKLADEGKNAFQFQDGPNAEIRTSTAEELDFVIGTLLGTLETTRPVAAELCEPALKELACPTLADAGAHVIELVNLLMDNLAFGFVPAVSSEDFSEEDLQ